MIYIFEKEGFKRHLRKDEVGKLADNICKWSNEIYWEKFETHAYQEQPPKW